MKLIFKAVSLFVILFNTNPSHAFKYSRCERIIFSKALGALGGMLSSTSQFVTSTGECRMFGEASPKERQLFIVNNAERIKDDIVRADGDFLNVVVQLYGCQNSTSSIGFEFQKNLTRIYGDRLDNDPKRVSEEVEAFVHQSPLLQTYCFKGV